VKNTSLWELSLDSSTALLWYTTQVHFCPQKNWSVMAQKITFLSQPRTLSGKKVGQLRRVGLIPANISGDLEKTVSVTVEAKKFAKIYEKVGDTSLFYLTVEGETADRPVLVNEVQLDPVTSKVLHVVFRQVNLTETITAEVSVEVINEVELKNVILATLHNTIEVEALPQDLPEKFEIDVSTLTAAGQMITFRQLNYDKSKVKLMIDEAQLDDPVVMIQEVKEEVEVVEPVVNAAATAETPVAGTPAAQPPAAVK